MSEITYFRTKHFDRALKEAKLGGQSRKAAVKVSAVLGCLGDRDPFASIQLTKNCQSACKRDPFLGEIGVQKGPPSGAGVMVAL